MTIVDALRPTSYIFHGVWKDASLHSDVLPKARSWAPWTINMTSLIKHAQICFQVTSELRARLGTRIEVWYHCM